ncbi:MAG TPA: hypothetical protein VN612_13840 [Acidobacteriaceae bacterium]|nr:hypothetical protein [Acidobacteriaceae bacterium]
MAAIGEQSLQWFATERVAVDEPAAPDLPAIVREHSPLTHHLQIEALIEPLP